MLKGNKVKEINESQIESCVQQGYTIKDVAGRVIRETVPTDLASLKLAYTKNEETIKNLKSTNEALKLEIASLKAAIKELQDAKSESDSMNKPRNGKAKAVKE